MKGKSIQIRGEVFVLNGALKKPENSDRMFPDPTLYEVVRCLNGKILFLNDHLDRLKSSCQAIGIQTIDQQLIIDSLNLLMQSVNIQEGNIRIEIHPHEETLHYRCYFVPHSYPESSDYINGVSTISLSAQRDVPGVKRQNLALREQTDALLSREGIYEVLLLNEQKRFTEGSRSNLFFLDTQDRIITAPAEKVLEGITRKYVLEVIHQLDLKVIFDCLPYSALPTIKGCFLSGTSPKVLPIHKVDRTTFEVDHPILRAIMIGYDQIMMQ